MGEWCLMMGAFFEPLHARAECLVEAAEALALAGEVWVEAAALALAEAVWVEALAEASAVLEWERRAGDSSA